MNFNAATIVSIKGSDYRIHFWYMSKNDAISIINNSYLDKKKWIVIKFFLLYIKTEWKTLSKKQRNNTK